MFGPFNPYRRIPHYPHGGPHGPRAGGPPLDIPDTYYGPRDPTSGGAIVSPDFVPPAVDPWRNILPQLTPLFTDLMTGEQGYQDFLSRQGNDQLNAQPGFFGFKSGGWIQKATDSIKRRGTEGVCTGDKFGSSSCPPGSKRYNLAKTFKKMARNRQMGGPAELGYSDGSPYRNSPMINIPGNNIDMNNTSMPLMLLPNQGRPTMAPPRSGSYYFPGASNVQEIPMRQMGGPGMQAFFNNPQAILQANAAIQAQENSKPVEAVLRPKGDPWEYRKTASGYQTKKKNSDKWITLNESTNKGLALPAVANLFGDSQYGSPVASVPKAKSQYRPGDGIVASAGVSASQGSARIDPSFMGPINTQSTQQTMGIDEVGQSYGPPAPSSRVYSTLPNNGLDPSNPLSRLTATSSGDNITEAQYLGAMPHPGEYYANVLLPELAMGAASAIPGGAAIRGLSTVSKGLSAVGKVGRTAAKVPKKGTKAYTDFVKSQMERVRTTRPSVEFDYYGNPIRVPNPVKVRSYQMGGEVQDNEPIEVQTEQGEVIAFGDGTLVPVKAKKSHKKMDKDEVTDVLPKGTYIFSKDKRMTFRPEQRIGGIVLEDLVIGKSVVQYSEVEPTPAPEEITLGKILTKKMTSADIANKIRVMFPVTDREKDPFAKWANDENKQSRLPYLQALVAISETKRPKKVEKFQYGGVTKLYDDRTLYGMAAMDNVLKRDNQLTKTMALPSNILSTSHSMGLGKSKFFPRTFQGGGGLPFNPLGALGPLLDFGLGIFDRMKGAKYHKETMGDIGLNQDTTRGYLGQARGLGHAGNLLNYGLQDRGYDFLDTTPLISSSDNTYGQVLRSIQADKSSAQQLPLGQANSFARYASGSGMSPTQIGNYAGQIGAQGIGQSNQAGLQYNQMYNNALLGQGATSRGYQREMIGDRQLGRNYMRGARNEGNANLIQGMVGTENNYLQGMSDLDMQTLAAKMAARGQQMNFMTNNGMRIGDAAYNLGNGIYNATRPPYDPYGTNMRYGYGDPGGYSTPNYGAGVPYSGSMAGTGPNYYGLDYNPGPLPPFPPGYNRWSWDNPG